MRGNQGTGDGVQGSVNSTLKTQHSKLSFLLATGYWLLAVGLTGCSMYQVTEETNRETSEVIRLLEKFNHEQERALRDMNLISNIKSATREQVQKQEKLHEMVKQQARYVRQDLYHNQNIHDNTAKMKKSFTNQITLNQGVLKSTSTMKENLEAAGELNKALTVKLDEAIKLNK